jgi:hypothetical protein
MAGGMIVKLYVNVNENGEIIETFGGVEEIIPDKVYDYLFDAGIDVLLNTHLYKVVNGELIVK